MSYPAFVALPMKPVGEMFALFLDTLRALPKRPFQWREFVDQAWFVASVTILPTMLVSIPFGAVIALQLGNLAAQIGAQSYTGAAAVLAIVREAGPIVTALLNDLCGLADPVVLVLDDYHVIDAQDVHASVAYLIDHAPSLFHLVIASRSDPPLPLARLRARGQLVEVRAADLRFTSEEAADYLNGTMGLGLADTAIASLGARTEGWIAALQLAAPRIVGEHDPTVLGADQDAGVDLFQHLGQQRGVEPLEARPRLRKLRAGVKGMDGDCSRHERPPHVPCACSLVAKWAIVLWRC